MPGSLGARGALLPRSVEDRLGQNSSNVTQNGTDVVKDGETMTGLTAESVREIRLERRVALPRDSLGWHAEELDFFLQEAQRGQVTCPRSHS